MKKNWLFIFIYTSCFLADFAFDVIVKWMTFRFIKEPTKIFSLGPIDLFLSPVFNKGAAWGMFSNYAHSLLVFRFLILAILIYSFIRQTNILYRLGIIYIVAGAWSNIFDYLMHGYVLDMFHFTFWTRSYGIFNCADAFIFIGAALLIYSSFKKNSHVDTKETHS